MTKQIAKKSAKQSTQKVDFEPNKMTVTIAMLAIVALVLVTLIAMLT